MECDLFFTFMCLVKLHLLATTKFDVLLHIKISTLIFIQGVVSISHCDCCL